MEGPTYGVGQGSGQESRGGGRQRGWQGRGGVRDTGQDDGWTLPTQVLMKGAQLSSAIQLFFSSDYRSKGSGTEWLRAQPIASHFQGETQSQSLGGASSLWTLREGSVTWSVEGHGHQDPEVV